MEQTGHDDERLQTAEGLLVQGPQWSRRQKLGAGQKASTGTCGGSADSRTAPTTRRWFIPHALRAAFVGMAVGERDPATGTLAVAV